MSKSNHKAAKRTRRNFKTQADALFSAAIRRIGYCEECGETAFLQCAHIVSRSYSAIRTDFRNAVALCRSCHMFYTPRPLEWEAWAIARLGEDLYRHLRFLAVQDYALKVDWAVEVERLRSEVPEMRLPPARFRRGR